MRHLNKGRSRARRLAVLALAALAALAVQLSFFRVQTGEYAVVTEFGDPVQVVTDPGLGIKYPYQSVRKLDARLYVHTPPFSEFLTLDKTAVSASGVVLWRVEDPRKYFETVFNRAGAESTSLRYPVRRTGRGNRAQPAERLRRDRPGHLSRRADPGRGRPGLPDTARRDYGIDVVDVQLQRFDFPERNRLRVYARMKSERAQISMKYRSEGEEEGLKIRAGADEERVRIRSEAFKVAEQHRGRGEAEAARIYAETLEKAPDFYRFLRTLEASRKFIKEGATLVLPANSELFGLLYDSKHYQRPAEASPRNTPAPEGGPPGREPFNQ